MYFTVSMLGNVCYIDAKKWSFYEVRRDGFEQK